MAFAFSTLTLLIWRLEGHSVCKKLSVGSLWWWFDWSFALHRLPSDTTATSTISRSMQWNQKRFDIIVPACTCFLAVMTMNNKLKFQRAQINRDTATKRSGLSNNKPVLELGWTYLVGNLSRKLQNKTTKQNKNSANLDFCSNATWLHTVLHNNESK